MKRLYLCCLIITILFTRCYNSKKEFLSACKSIDTAEIRTYVRELGSDRYMGRAPFTAGEEMTVRYLSDRLKSEGFEPLFSGSWFQDVPMVKISSSVDGPVVIKNHGKQITFNYPEDFAIISPQLREQIKIDNSEMVFAGFGIVAPEYGWDDYKDLDVKGKTVIVMINDPGLYSGDTSLFKGSEMTYYGRWTYKYEEAARHNAAGVIIIHETKGAGYEYNIPRHSATSPNYYIQSPDSNLSRCQFTGWVSADAADRLMSATGLNANDLRAGACRRGFKGFPLNMSISFSLKNSCEYNKSRNVGGYIKGTTRPDECIIYTAHWDHFGIGEKENGDSIYNGAVDNGTSMAWELAMGRAFSKLKHKPGRSVVLLFPTAEEQGLLGSMYYAENPVFPANKTVACINNDLMVPMGRMKDVMITGFGQSDLDDLVREAAEKQGRYVTADPESFKGMYFRSDHFSFARKGIPSLFARGNTDSREFGKEWASSRVKDYMDNRYHRAADNYDPLTWNLEGIAEDAVLCFDLGYRLSTTDLFPKWKKDSEFRNLRK